MDLNTDHPVDAPVDASLEELETRLLALGGLARQAALARAIRAAIDADPDLRTAKQRAGYKLSIIEAAAYAANVAYWQPKGTWRPGWTILSREDMERDTGVEVKHQAKARGLLQTLGWLQAERHGVPPRWALRLDYAAMLPFVLDGTKASTSGSNERGAQTFEHPRPLNERRPQTFKRAASPDVQTNGVPGRSLSVLSSVLSSNVSTLSLKEPQQPRNSAGRRAADESPTPSRAGESSGNESKDLKSKEQELAPRSRDYESPPKIATPPAALAVSDTDLSDAARETLAAALGRQTELKGAANIAHTRRRLLALRGEDEAAWMSLLSHATRMARTCVASLAETHAARPADAGKSLSDAEREERRRIYRGGSFSERTAFVEDAAPRDMSNPAVAARAARGDARWERRNEARRNHPNDSYEQFGVRISDGTRPHISGPAPDLRKSARGLLYELLTGERSDDKFADVPNPHAVTDVPGGLAERDAIHAVLDAHPERLAQARATGENLDWVYALLEDATARAASIDANPELTDGARRRRRGGYEWLFDDPKITT